MNFHKMDGSFDPGSTKNAIPFGENCKKSYFSSPVSLRRVANEWLLKA